MSALTPDEHDFFHTNGYLVVPDAVEPDLLARLEAEFQIWKEESRQHQEAYGETIDGRARFDLEPGHTSDTPALRRISAPDEISDAYFEAMSNSRMTDCVAALIGPNVKFHHSKVNSKLPGAGTAVKWHQDFPFTPHNNDDLVTALLMVDAVTEENGPLEVLPGSHRGPLHNLWHNDVFTGAIDDAEAARCRRNATLCTGNAGSVCLMHTRLLHGSAPNRSDRPRTLLISVFSAEDAVPCCPNPVPSVNEGLVVRGAETGNVRTVAYELRLPRKPTGASFFERQAIHDQIVRGE